ncbi:MAG: hemerythrin domain-containing protein [Candidatus Omnitrophota bacterium]
MPLLRSLFLIVFLAACSCRPAAGESNIPVSATEDLMREHGLLSRLLLIYEDAVVKLKAGEEYPVEILAGATRIVRKFIEDYHERLEEDHVFPLFEKAGPHKELAALLRKQHDAGRRVTDELLRLTGERSLSPEDRVKLIEGLQKYIRMYRPHEAREDTVLFPAFREIVSAEDYETLGEEFEKEEKRLFGEGGFGKMVDEVKKLEESAGIQDLSQFTPAPKSEEFI